MSHGPVQYFMITFPGNQLEGDLVSALEDVVAKGAIRIVDIVFIKKDMDGRTSTLEVNDLGDADFNAFAGLVDHTEGLLSEEDISEFAANIPLNHVATLLVFELLWAVELAEAIREANGEVVTQGFVPHEVVEAVLRSRTEAA